MTGRKILMIKGDYDRAGGPETLLSGILHTLDPQKYQPSLVVLRKTVGNGADILQNGEKNIEMPWRGLVHARSASRSLSEYVEDNKVQLIHTHDMRSNLAAYLMGRLRRVPWVAHVHGWLGKTHRGKFRVYERIDQHLIKKADLVVVGSSVTANEARYYGAKRVEIVPNCIMLPSSDSTQVVTKKSLGVPSDRFLVGVVGRVHPGKGQTVLIHAIEKLVKKSIDIHLLVVGDGPDMVNVRALVAALGIENRVTFTGYHPDAISCLPLMDLVVVPSLKESLPLTALEAMARKCCVIASKVGDLPQVIQHEVNGYLVEPASADQLADMIAKLIDQPTVRSAVGDAAFKRIRDAYSMESMSRRLEAIYDRLIGSVDMHG